ncbi:MAG: diaminopimelate decarboxylase, partial [Candidatus Binatia bacterium]
MAGFHRPDGALACDGVPLADIALREGTPLYVYSADTIISRYRDIDEAFRSYPHALHYALKANSTLAIARLLRGLGAGADANSGGEIDVALRAGFIPA